MYNILNNWIRYSEKLDYVKLMESDLCRAFFLLIASIIKCVGVD